MREILFRGFHECENGKEKAFYNNKWHNGEWMYGFYENYNGKSCVCRQSERLNTGNKPIRELIRVVLKTVGQFTGSTDKRKKKIFEGDIISYRNMIFIIEWQENDGRFLGIEKNKNRPDGEKYICYVSDELKNSIIIGNIHDNPELLTQEVTEND